MMFHIGSKVRLTEQYMHIASEEQRAHLRVLKGVIEHLDPTRVSGILTATIRWTGPLLSDNIVAKYDTGNLQLLN